MRKNIFFMISVLLIFSQTANCQQENNSTKLKTLTKQPIETNSSNKTIEKKNTTKDNIGTTSNKKIFIIKGSMQNNNLKLKSGIQFPINFQSTYKTKRHDTLGSIANKFGVAQGEIKSLNPGVDFDKLSSGIELSMPVSQSKIDEIEKQLEAAKRGEEEGQKFIFSPTGNQLRVIATAYTSHPGQTDSTPFIGAWGHKLVPGTKTIAVSRDLISNYGITDGTKVQIGGLDGYYIVRDTMNKRFTKRIDIYMGLDRRKALVWGKRSVMIYW